MAHALRNRYSIVLGVFNDTNLFSDFLAATVRLVLYSTPGQKRQGISGVHLADKLLFELLERCRIVAED